MCTAQYTYEFSLWHTEHDTDIALDVAGILEESGYRGFVEHRDQASGVPAISAADNVIQSSRVSLLILSSHFQKECWCKWVSNWCLVNAIVKDTARVILIYIDLQENEKPDILRHLTSLNYHSRFFKKKLLDSMKSKTGW